MNDQPKPKGRGCFFYGCLITVALVVIGALVGFLTLRYVVHKTLVTYTDPAPEQLPEVVISPPEIKEAQRRWAAFFEGVKGDQPLAPLTLTADDLNALIAGTGTNGLRDKLRVTIEGGELKAQACFPLDRLKQSALKGRFLNGTIVFKVGLEDGVLSVRADSVRVKDRPLPGWLMSKLRGQNWAQNVMNNMNAVAMLQNLESVAVTNDMLVITPKAP